MADADDAVMTIAAISNKIFFIVLLFNRFKITLFVLNAVEPFYDRFKTPCFNYANFNPVSDEIPIMQNTLFSLGGG